MSTIMMPPNKVLLKRIGLQDDLGGFQIADDEHSEHRLLPNVAEVVAVCSSLAFTFDRVKELKQQQATQHEIQFATQASCLFLCDIEIKPGDKVIYRAVNNVIKENIYWKVDNEAMLVINHDDLIARLDGDKLYPLCGNVIIERSGSITRVVAQGKPVERYFHFPDYKDFDVPMEGRTVVLNPNQAMPVSDVAFGRYPDLSFIRRRHINLLIDEAQS